MKQRYSILYWRGIGFYVWDEALNRQVWHRFTTEAEARVWIAEAEAQEVTP